MLKGVYRYDGFISGFVCILSVFFLAGWHNAGHELIVELSMKKLSGQMPEFFIEGIGQVAHCAVDPDVFKEKIPDVALVRSESPEHYFDLEYYTGEELPEDRYAFYRWCYEHERELEKVGTLPWSLTEYTGKLTLAFAEYRKWPENRHIQAKCLVYAGLLAHYTGDAAMPLHATMHFDGMIKAGSEQKEHKGIHRKLDALLEKIPRDKQPVIEELSIIAFGPKLLPGVYAFLRESNSLVADCYELAERLPDLPQKDIVDDQVMLMAQKHLCRAVSLTSGLYLYAWQASTEVQLPDWHVRKY
ncbi:MAG: hypothetical protein JW745_04330 [Sedimentisphaerales bacterium]|nr:hypothetical protein [Sedimentisphaerales bacterium]MBN2842882.1 hypothetical protein [Sedimentisphaerales bacterium]